MAQSAIESVCPAEGAARRNCQRWDAAGRDSASYRPIRHGCVAGKPAAARTFVPPPWRRYSAHRPRSVGKRLVKPANCAGPLRLWKPAP